MVQPGGLARLRAKLNSNDIAWRQRNVVIVALGDSVTQGLTLNPALLHDETYHALLRRGLAAAFPERTFSSINAGVGGESAAAGLARLQSDALDPHPDIVTVAFGLNDSGGGEAKLEPFSANLREIVKRIAASGAFAVLMTPNMMATRDNGRVDPKFADKLPAFIERQTSGLLARYAEAVRRVGSETGVPVADVYAEWERREAAGEDMMAHLANGINHPDAYGHRLAADVLLRVVLDSAKG